MKSQYSKKYKLTICLLSIILFFLGCVDDKMIDEREGNGEGVSIQFEIQTIKILPPKSITKSGQIATENTINEIDILVFENNKYKYRVEALNIAFDGNATTTFNARIKSSNNPITLFIIANANTEIDTQTPQVDEDIEVVKNSFYKTISQNGISGNLPMWGSYAFPTGISATVENNVTGIKMLRSMARVDVVNVNAVPFQLATIQAFHVADKMQIIPNNVIGKPSIPVGTSYSIATTPIATTSTTSSTSQLYLPESESIASGNILDATCIVIGGYYNGSSTLSYYRLDFNLGIEGHPFGQILRNNRYEFNLTRINREGYASALEAVNNISSGIGVTIVQWQDYIRNIVFNTDAYFGVSSNLITLLGKINSTETILTETDVTGYTLRWANSQGVPSGTASSTLIENDYFKVEKSSNGSTIDITTKQENPIGSGVRNIRYVLVEAQKLQMLLTLIQEPDLFTPGEVIWSVNNVDTPGTFAPRIQDTGMFYQWNRRVGWPATGSVTGWDNVGADGNLWEDVTDPCPQGWRVPSSKELDALLNDSPGRIWRSIYNTNYEISGMWFAPTQAEAESATFNAPGNALFLPASGGRKGDSSLFNRDSNGYYWTDDLELSGRPYVLSIVDGTSGLWPVQRAEGYNVRCVRANN